MTQHEEAAKRIAHAILDRSTEGAATRVALKQAIAGGGERDLGGLNAIALAEVISEQLAALIANVRRQSLEEASADNHRMALEIADMKREAAELRARVAEMEQQVPKWLPIDSAPKDRRILLHADGWEDPVVGRFDNERNAKTPRPYWTNTREHFMGKRYTRDHQPTRWMPLPAAPKEEV